MPETELRPCPFCGSNLVGPLTESSCPGDRLGVVGCGACGASGPSLFDAGELVARWNARADTGRWCAMPEAMTDERLDELRAIYSHPHLHPGPWADDGGYRVFAPATAAEQDAGLGAEVVLCECKILHGTAADNAAMAAARTAVPELLVEVDRLRAECGEWWRAVNAVYRADETEDDADRLRLRSAGWHDAYELMRGRGWANQPPCAAEILAGHLDDARAEIDRLRAALAAETERCAGIAERIAGPGCGCAECEAVAVAVARIRGGRPR